MERVLYIRPPNTGDSHTLQQYSVVNQKVTADSKMFAKLLFVACALVAVSSKPAADRYPAGVNPALCPNYPHCDNALLAAHNSPAGYAGAFPAGAYHTPAATAYAGHGAYYAAPGAYHGAGAYAPGAYNTGAYTGAGAYAAPGYPAGVNPASCPNYPYCTNYAPGAYHAAAAPLPGFAARQYPDGVNPATCPNYPYCH